MITDERMVSFLSSLEKEKPEILYTIEKKALEEQVPIIKKPTQSLLRFLMTSRKPVKILEVGTAVGFSSIFMHYYAGENCSITTIEKVKKRIEQAKQNFSQAKKTDKIVLLQGEAKDLLKELCKTNTEQFDFIFMDAAKGQYLSFLSDILKLLAVNGMLVSDNVLQNGDVLESRYSIIQRNRTIHSRMREYLYTLTHTENLETVILPIGDGVTLSIKKK